MTKQIGIVCHDAGGAEIISHWVKQNKINPILHLEGPAIKIFKRVLSKLNLVSLEELIENSNLLMLGTSWQSDLEKKSFIVARKKINLKIIVVFDHWVDFDFFGHQLVIHLSEVPKNETPSNPVDGKEVPVPHFGVVLDMDTFWEFAKRIEEKKVTFIIAPYVRFEGKPGEQATLFFKDPSGNALEFKAFKNLDQLFAT